eukprot:GHRQ01022802.1.p1 GENE.GHRQ01022802.1~~GHRQ01022802.1.p1  ORF type:complete len:142 (-),score=18.81 GHRQ01022802.1:124-549(-)
MLLVLTDAFCCDCMSRVLCVSCSKALMQRGHDAGTLSNMHLRLCVRCPKQLHCLQVLLRDYNQAADMWSAGVIMYILLCGYPPFCSKSDSRILQKVQQGSYSFVNREVRCSKRLVQCSTSGCCLSLSNPCAACWDGSLWSE